MPGSTKYKAGMFHPQHNAQWCSSAT